MDSLAISSKNAELIAKQLGSCRVPSLAVTSNAKRCRVSVLASLLFSRLSVIVHDSVTDDVKAC